MSGGDQWKDRLADGIQIDDSLLLDDNEGSGMSPTRAPPLQGSSSAIEVAIGLVKRTSFELAMDRQPSIEEEVDEEEEEEDYDDDTYDQFGRTPPRTRVLQNRKWKDQRKQLNELEQASIRHASRQAAPPSNRGGRKSSFDSPRRRRSLVKGGVKAMVAAVRGSFPHMGGIHDDDDEMYDEADAGFDYRSPDLGPRHHPSRSSGKRVTISRDYERDTKYSQQYRETAMSVGPGMMAGTVSSAAAVASSSSAVAGFVNMMMHQTDSLPIGSASPVSVSHQQTTAQASMLKVETSCRFTSLMSKPVHPNSELDLSPESGSAKACDLGRRGSMPGGAGFGVGFQTPVKRSSQQGTDRYAFHRLFASTVKSSQLTQGGEKLDLARAAKSMEGMSHLDLMRRKSTGHALVLAAQAAKAAEAEEEEEAREVYQNNMADLIWLELQAWFAGQNMVDHDRYITNIRETDIKDTIYEILDYEYRTREESENARRSLKKVTMRESSVVSDVTTDTSDMFYDARESPGDDLSASFKRDYINSGKSPPARLNSVETAAEAGLIEQLPTDEDEDDNFGLEIKMDQLLKEELNGGDGIDKVNDITGEDDSIAVDEDDEDVDLRFSLDIYNVDRVCIMNEALGQVRGLLDKLDVAERYYASGKMFRTDHAAVGSAEFNARVKCLCMWYNLTVQLRSKIDGLGNLLLGMGAARRKVPWPTWFNDYSDYPKSGFGGGGGFSDESGVTSPLSASQNFPAGIIASSSSAMLSAMSREASVQEMEQAVASAAHNNQCKVRFKLCEDEANSSNPSDSNNSTSTDSGNPKSNPNSNPAHRAPSQPPQPAATTTTGRQISNMSGASSSGDEFDRQSSFAGNPYMKYVDQHLKTKGLRKTMAFLQRLIRGSLRRAKTALERTPQMARIRAAQLQQQQQRDGAAAAAQQQPQPPMPPGSQQPYHPHLEERFNSHPVPSEDEQELRTYGVWNPYFEKMNLPSFRAPYLFLCRIPLDVIHACLKLRLEQKPQEPSELSIRQLMRECKEVLRLAVIERQKYISRVRAAIFDTEADRDFLDAFEQDMEEFDQNLTLTLEVYLSYLQMFVTMIQSDSALLVSSSSTKSLLEEEWAFVKQTCPHIPDGESFSGNTFCQMACGMLRATGDFLNKEIDEVVKRMFVYSDSEGSDDEAAIRHQVYEACRGFQSVFAEAKERSQKALAFAKTLRKDLEVSAEFTPANNDELGSGSASTDELVQRLQESNHVRVLAPHSSQHLIFISGVIRDRQDHILQLLDMHCGSDQSSGGGSNSNDGSKDASLSADSANNPGYLVLMKCSASTNGSADDACIGWTGDTIYVKPTAETTISLSQIEVEGVLLVAPNASSLSHRRKEFLRAMKDSLVVKHDQRATSHRIASSLEQVKQEALALRDTISQQLSEIEGKCDVSGMGDLDPADKDALSRRTREILHQCYKFGFEYHKELDRLVTGQVSQKSLARGVTEFARQWTSFVSDRCERGKGVKPRWAVHGVEFLIIASGPNYTKHLNDEEFAAFKALVERCYGHIIGEAPAPQTPTTPSGGAAGASQQTSPPSPNARPFSRSNSRARMSSPAPSVTASRKTSMPAPSLAGADLAKGNLERSGSSSMLDGIRMPPPGSPYIPRRGKKTSSAIAPDEPDTPGVEFKVPPFAHLPWADRVTKSIASMEKNRDSQRKKDRFIGSVLDKVHREDRIHIKAKTVNFSWQRGNKIGQGTFGKVYTAINNETGDIMAMKELPLQPNDHKTLRNVAEELRIFESIRHKHLINHYGVEVHREEMLIFMEYCPEGSLEELVSNTDAGLEETLIRRYTRQLLEAVVCLHEHGVVHRDIKGANIFLTDDMKNLKLGDYGSAVKIKQHTTMPGELQGHVGTQAYMAPEVFTSNMSEGHGRAADIWSSGCVVVEMATGKRPWHELESNYQIMFKVGMGDSPPTPESLSKEGAEFLEMCLEHDPRQRATATDLLAHPFLKVYDEEENASLPMFTSLADHMPDYKRFQVIRKNSFSH